jgi:predicted aldo/keto reductase-like oxidoreductase
MKTLKGARATALKDFADRSQVFSQAAFRWVLSNPDVSSLVVTIRDFQQIDEYLFASGQELTPSDLALREEYNRLVARDYCRPGCGRCLDRCPHGVPIDDVFRYAMYYENYGKEREAVEKYAGLSADRNAWRCVTCPAPCEAACPFDIPIRAKLISFHPELALG